MLFANLLSAPLEPQRVLGLLETAYGELNRLTSADLERVEVKDQPAPSVAFRVGLVIKGYWGARRHYCRRKEQ